MLANRDRPISTLGLIEPLMKNKHLFHEFEIEISGIFEKVDEVIETDVLLADSKFFRSKWVRRSDQALSELCELKSRVNNLFFYDSSDSTGNVQPQVMPVVDRYLKAQVLRDRRLYQEHHYGGRVYTDYFFHEEQVEDIQPLSSQCVSSEELSKIRTAWNVGLVGGYGVAENIFERSGIRQLLRLYPPRRNGYCEPIQTRKLDVFLRMSLNQGRNTVAFQRKKAVNCLRYLNTLAGPIEKKQYLKEMRESKLIVAPFSWGEMSMRDFECFVTGGILVKPSMSHMETFPDYYKEGETYIPVDWALNDLPEIVDNMLANYQDYIEIATEGQKRFRYYAEQLEGRLEFVEYAAKLFRDQN